VSEKKNIQYVTDFYILIVNSFCKYNFLVPHIMCDKLLLNRESRLTKNLSCFCLYITIVTVIPWCMFAICSDISYYHFRYSFKIFLNDVVAKVGVYLLGNFNKHIQGFFHTNFHLSSMR